MKKFTLLFAALAAMFSLQMSAQTFYKLTAVFPNGNEHTVFCDGEKLTAGEVVPENALTQFEVVVRNEEDSTLTLRAGDQFIHWTSGDNTNKSDDLDGLNEEYDEAINVLKMFPAYLGGTFTSDEWGIIDEDVDGLWQIQGQGTGGFAGRWFDFTLRENDDAWIAGDPGNYFFDTNWDGNGCRTSFFRVEVFSSAEEIAELVKAYSAAKLKDFSNILETEEYENLLMVFEECQIVVEVGFATQSELETLLAQLDEALNACIVLSEGIKSSEALIDKATAVYEKTQPALFNLSPKAEQFSSNAPCPSEGNIANLVDDNVNTFFHSDWTGTYSAQVDYDVHELYISGLNPDIKDFIVSVSDRVGADNDHIATMEVYGGTVEKDEENTQLGFFTCTSGDEPLATIELDGSRPSTHNANLSIGDTGYETLCFRVTNTKNKAGNDNFRVYFHCSEFRLYANDGVTFDEPTYKVSEEKQQALMDAIDALQEAVNDFNAEQFEALQAALQAAITTIEEEVLFDVTYEYVWKGKVVATETIQTICGHDLPKPEYALPFGVSVEAPQGTVTAAVTVQLPCKAELPFKYYSNPTYISKWYTIASHESFRELWRYDAEMGYVPLDSTVVDTEDKAAFAWGFVGDPFEGFQIYNKKAGADYVLANVPTMEGNTGVDTRPYPTKVDELADGMVSVFKAHAGTTDASFWMGFYCESAGKDVWMNRRADSGDMPVLAYWSSAGDAGSNLNVEEIEVIDANANYYSITAVFPNDSRHIVFSDGEKLTAAAAENVPEGAITAFEIVSEDENGLVLRAGSQFVHWTSGDDTNKSDDLDGLNEDFSEAINVLQLAPADIDMASTSAEWEKTADDVEGLYQIRGYGTGNHAGSLFDFTLRENDDAWIAGNPGNTFFDTNWDGNGCRTSFFLLTKVGGADGIKDVIAEPVKSGAIYDIFGRKVTELQKGVIYVRDGKKFIVK